MARKLERLGWRPFSGAAVSAATSIAAKLFATYHPERHYMRGPGPKTLEKLGEELRARTDATVKEPLPEAWLSLIHGLDKRESSSRMNCPPSRIRAEKP